MPAEGITALQIATVVVTLAVAFFAGFAAVVVTCPITIGPRLTPIRCEKHAKS